MGFLAGLLGRQPDGESAVLESIATGIPPALLSAATSGDVPAPPEPVAPSRRDRPLDGGHDVLLDTLAQKILHGWLQNRHQTLFPLTVNLRTLDTAQHGVLAQWMALSLLAGMAHGPRLADARAWFASVGADPATLVMLDTAVTTPPALSDVLAGIGGHGLSAYAYVVALVALDPRDPASLPFLDYVAARLALPTAVVRSATRRYRR